MLKEIKDKIKEYENQFKCKPHFLIISPDVLDFLKAHSYLLYENHGTLEYNHIPVAVIETKTKNKMEVR